MRWILFFAVMVDRFLVLFSIVMVWLLVSFFVVSCHKVRNPVDPEPCMQTHVFESRDSTRVIRRVVWEAPCLEDQEDE